MWRIASRWSSLFLMLAGLAAGAKEFSLKVDVGPSDRAPAILRFEAPADLPDGRYVVFNGKGQDHFVEVHARVGTCVLGAAKAGETLWLRTQPHAGAVDPAIGVVAAKGDVAVNFKVRGQSVFSYNFANTKLPAGVDTVFDRGGYIFPLLTGSGVQVLDDFPADHRHHHGIWLAWTKTEFEGRHPDFWNMGQKLARVEAVALDASWSGLTQGGFTARNRYVDLKAAEPKVVLNETWTTRLYNTDASVRLFDIDVEQTCASDAPLKLPKYHYGGIGVRGHAQWLGPKGMEFLTSEGKTRANGNETSGKWCAMTGKIDGKDATITILCHPSNFRFPQPMRLNPKEPFFCYAPQQGGEFSIEPGKPYRMKYRIAVTDGVPDATVIERLWNDYATPAAVSVEEVNGVLK